MIERRIPVACTGTRVCRRRPGASASNWKTYLRIEFGAELRLGRRGLPEDPRDDLVAVISSVLDEHLVGVIARDHDAGDEHACHPRLECRGIMRRDAGGLVDRHADLTEQLQ